MSQESRITTWYDMAEYLLHYAGADPQKQTIEDCRRAVVNGLREFCSTHTWSFLNTRGRIVTVPNFTDGTVTYSDTTRALTLTTTDGAVWPQWASFGSIFLNQIPYDVASRDSDTQITLAKRNPVGFDIPAPGITFTLYQDTYPMPVDYQASHEMIEYISGYICSYVSNAAWLEAGRSWRGMRGKPVIYAVASDPHFLGCMAARFHPIPDLSYSFDFIYHRLPRYLAVADYSVGTVTILAGSDAVVGVGTAFLPRMAGSIIRFGVLGQKLPPTSLTGSYPYNDERTVMAVTDGSSLTVDEPLAYDSIGVQYRISDPIDVEEGACMTAFHRECEKQLRLIRRMRPLFDGDSSESKEYQLSYLRARESDKRGIGASVAGAGLGYRRRLSDMPFLPNQP